MFSLEMRDNTAVLIFGHGGPFFGGIALLIRKEICL